MIEAVLPFEESVPVREQIDARRVVFRQTGSIWKHWQDDSQSDYKFWDAARRCKTRGLELSGLLLDPLVSKICAWVLGRSPLWQTENKSVSARLNAWWRAENPSIMRAYEEALALADCYLVFNGDGTLSVVAPDRVKRLVDPKNYGRLIGYQISTSYHKDDGYEAQTVVDTYTAIQRTRKVTDGAGSDEPEQVFLNPLGRIPVIHVANRKGVDEVYGRPEGEALLPALVRYGDVADAALKGNIRQGRPTPVIDNMGTAAALNDFYDRYGKKETVTRDDGTTEEIEVIPFDPDQLITLAGTAKFHYEAPGSFSVDTQNLLGLLFYLILQHSEVPEFVWGAAIGSSKASAESQLEPFLKFVEKKRGLAMAWIQELAEIVVTYFALFDRRARNQHPAALWKPIATADGRLALDVSIWAWSKHLWDDEFTTWMLPVNISDTETVKTRAEDYWGNEYGQSSPAASVPASGGGDQQNFKAENPIQPTERQQFSNGNGYLLEEESNELLDAFREFIKVRKGVAA